MDRMAARPPRHPALRAGFLGFSVALIAVTPAVALLPGPAGTFTLAGGLALVLQNSPWARRRFAQATRRYPRVGGLTDRALRRPSARRRRQRDAAR